MEISLRFFDQRKIVFLIKRNRIKFREKFGANRIFFTWIFHGITQNIQQRSVDFFTIYGYALTFFSPELFKV